MSKKVVIVPRHKWCVLPTHLGRFVEVHGFVSFKSRELARIYEKEETDLMKGKFAFIRKVSKIVYYYE